MSSYVRNIIYELEKEALMKEYHEVLKRKGKTSRQAQKEFGMDILDFDFNGYSCIDETAVKCLIYMLEDLPDVEGG